MAIRKLPRATGYRWLAIVLYGFCLLPLLTQAQWSFRTLDVSTNGGLDLGRFTQSQQVFDNRQDVGTVAAQFQLQALAQWQNGRHALQAGLGYRLDHWAMNRTNFGDVLAALLIIPFGGSGNINDGWPERVSAKIHQVSLPIGYNYRLSPNANAPVQVAVRLLVLPAFVAGKSISLQPENEPTPGIAAALQEDYKNAAGQWSLMVAPELNLHFQPTPGGATIYFGLQPFAADLVRPTAEWMKGGLVLRTTLGMQIPLVKK